MLVKYSRHITMLVKYSALLCSEVFKASLHYVSEVLPSASIQGKLAVFCAACVLPSEVFKAIAVYVLPVYCLVKYSRHIAVFCAA